ncbi:MAG: NAD(P)/FAD-dependent oxidoreductase [Isosphaeraceae bacterium]
MSQAPQHRPRVVIVGCGFAGLEAAKALKHASIRLTVIDRSNHHLFQPLLYQVATAALNPSDIAAPIRRILRGQRNAEVELADVTAIDPAARRVILADGSLEYDFLILATGASHSYFGRDDWEAHAPGLKSIDDALEIRRRMLLAFEAAEREDDPESRRAWMTFVIVGGGPTGVELAGTFRDVARYTLARDFRRIDPATARVVLVEGSDRILHAYAPELSRKAREQLESKGVEVLESKRVADIDQQGVRIGGDRIEARTVLWAAGVKASPLAQTLGVPLDRIGRVQVEPDLSIPGHSEVFVVGDLMALEQDGHQLPGVAPTAMQAGKHAARNILASLNGRPREPFRYLDKGSMATIGRNAAVADIRGFRCWGFLAWLMWLFVHILFLISFRNRLIVLVQWAWGYLTYDRGARLITQVTLGPLDQLDRPGLDARPREAVGP